MEKLGFTKAHVVAAAIKKMALDREEKERKNRVDEAIRLAIKVMEEKIERGVVQDSEAPVERIDSDEIIPSDVSELDEYGWSIFKADNGCWYITLSDCICESYGIESV